MISKHPFSDRIQSWYQLHQRDLPWRNIQNPYLIWISEVILQQTRVAQGLEYYLRFVERFPTVSSLAKAQEEEVLKFWQGLGYYSRARNLHKAAKQIVEKHNGIFPKIYNDILNLSGIGVYTASAIASFAFGQAYAVVDGNVYRVLARYFGIETAIDTSSGQKEFSALATNLLDSKNPALYNQAIMEFGALQCVPKNPNCQLCPLVESCVAYNSKTIHLLPKKSQKVKTKPRYFNYLFFNYQSTTFFYKRNSNDIWKNLYEFPMIESEKLLEINDLLVNQDFLKITNSEQTLTFGNTYDFKHILTHRHIYARFFSINLDNINSFFEQYTAISLAQIDQLPTHRLTELFFEKIK